MACIQRVQSFMSMRKVGSRADFQVCTFSNPMKFLGLVGGVINWTRKRLRLWIYGGGVYLTLRGLQVCQ